MLGARSGQIFIKLILPASRWLEKFLIRAKRILGFTSLAYVEHGSLKGIFFMGRERDCMGVISVSVVARIHFASVGMLNFCDILVPAHEKYTLYWPWKHLACWIDAILSISSG